MQPGEVCGGAAVERRGAVEEPLREEVVGSMGMEAVLVLEVVGTGFR